MRKSVVIETLALAVIGLVFALAANGISPKGLKLGRNYFPEGRPSTTNTAEVTPPPSNTAAVTVATSNAAPPRPNPTDERIIKKGLQIIKADGVNELFNDPRYKTGLIVFIDARDDNHYGGGHIPGAYQFNHYEQDKYLPQIIPLCKSALKVVVYCTGGECEDSEFAAVTLRDVGGVGAQSLYVYTGGITEWTALGRPVETGARLSGQLLKPKP